MKPTSSVFPNDIDDRVFFQDVSLNQVNDYKHYLALLSQGRYSDASDFLNQSTLTSYGSWWLLYFTDKINKITDEIIRKGVIRDNALDAVILASKNLSLSRYSSSMPTDSNLKRGYIWIQ